MSAPNTKMDTAALAAPPGTEHLPLATRSPCLDEGTVLSLFAGRLSAERMAGLEQHLDGCEDCGALIQAAAPLVAGASGRAALGGLPEMAEPGRVLADRYRLERLIGWGATGFVFRAEDRVTATPVAVKMLREECAAQPALLERLTRELKVARALMHPNVGRVFDLSVHGEAAGEPRFLVMDLARGSLLDELREDQDLPAILSARLSDAQGVASGLGAMHDAGILHRDIKPANLLRMADGRLVISDFGLATLDLERPAMTRYVGTPFYMAPEVVCGDRATWASDIWSLGMVIHELCFQRRPEWRTSRRGRRTLALPARASSRLQRALLDLCEQCLSALPAERPTARLVASRLRALAAGQVPTRRAPAVVLGGLLLVSAGMGLLVAVSLTASERPAAKAPPPRAPEIAAPSTDRAPLASAHTEEFRLFIRSTTPAVKECYEQALRGGLDPSGRREIRMRIGADGKVRRVMFEGNLPVQLADCLAPRLKALTMSPPPHQESELVFPFILGPPQGPTAR